MSVSALCIQNFICDTKSLQGKLKLGILWNISANDNVSRWLYDFTIKAISKKIYFTLIIVIAIVSNFLSTC